MNTKLLKVSVLLPLIFLTAQITYSQTTAFKYQGSLADGGSPANGSFQMQFKLFDAAGGGSQIGSALSDLPVTATNGVFAVSLDFGAAALNGANRWLEIAVRRNSGESYVTLSPREQISSAPYSVRTLSAATADVALDSQKLGGINASEYVTTGTVGNAFVKNDTVLQTANFNISGNGFIGGNLGIGTTTPGAKLDVEGGAIRARSSSSTHLVAEMTGGTNGWSRFYALNPTQRWFLGTSRDFNGNQFYLVDETFAQSRMTIQPAGGAISFPFGSVGIGTGTPTGKLDVRGDLTLDNGGDPVLFTGTANAEQTRFLSLVNSQSFRSASGLKAGGLLVADTFTYANPGKNDLIIKGNVGIGTATPNSKLNVVGNVTQDINSYGMPKAMLFVLANGNIRRCYNATTGVSLTAGTTNVGCGFSVNVAELGSIVAYEIHLGTGLPSANRFYSLTSNGGEHISGRIILHAAGGVDAKFWQTGQTNSETRSDFFLIVY